MNIICFKALEPLKGVTQLSIFSIQSYLISETQVSFTGFFVCLFVCFLLFHRFMALYIHRKMTELPPCQLMKHSYLRQCKNTDLWDSPFIPGVFTVVLPFSQSYWLPGNLQGLPLDMEVNEPEVAKWFCLCSYYCSSREGIFVLPGKGQHCCYKRDQDFIQRAKCCADLSADSSIYPCTLIPV